MNNGYGQHVISTKANTLYALSKVIKKSKIEKMYILPVSEYESNTEEVIEDIVSLNYKFTDYDLCKFSLFSI